MREIKILKLLIKLFNFVLTHQTNLLKNISGKEYSFRNLAFLYIKI